MILDQEEIVMIRVEWQWRTSQSPKSLCQLDVFQQGIL